jgi:hypothetical protein
MRSIEHYPGNLKTMVFYTYFTIHPNIPQSSH